MSITPRAKMIINKNEPPKINFQEIIVWNEISFYKFYKW